jgi:hypothetical protein
MNGRTDMIRLVAAFSYYSAKEPQNRKIMTRSFYRSVCHLTSQCHCVCPTIKVGSHSNSTQISFLAVHTSGPEKHKGVSPVLSYLRYYIVS